MHMSELLDEIREKATQRASELKREIRQAQDMIGLCEEELAPLLAILAATDPKPVPPTGTAEAVAAAIEAIEAAGEGAARPTVYNKTTELKEPRHPHTGEVLASGSSEAMLRVVALKKIGDEFLETKAVADKVASQAIAAQPAVVKVPPRWSQYKLPPRARLFLAKFGNVKGQIHRQQVMDWYATISPTIDPPSLKQAASDIAGILINKGILHRDAPGVYSYTKK